MPRVPHPKSPGVEFGVTETVIRRLVHEFYARIRQDEILGPIFEARVQDWETHLETMCSFWSSVILMTGSYKGQPMEVHARLPEVSDAHFARWLELFERSARECCESGAALLFVDRAERIAESLKMGIAIRRDKSVQLSAN